MKHSSVYSARFSKINFTSGSEISLEAEYSELENLAGLRRPNPPSLAGRAKRSRSWSLGGGFQSELE